MTIIETAIDRLTSKGWITGMLHTNEGYCMLGALGVEEDEAGYWINIPEIETLRIVHTIIDECVACNHHWLLNHPEPKELIYRHNDSHLKSAEDAILLLKKAAND